MKGYRTIVFNAVMLVAGVTGAQVAPEMANDFAEAFVAVLALGNGLLRLITNTPIFKKDPT